MEERFVELCKKRSLKVSDDKRKVMVLGGKEGSVCEVVGACVKSLST